MRTAAPSRPTPPGGVLHRARRRAAQRPATTTATKHATASLRAAITLLGWLAGRGIRLAEIHQSDIDRWLLDGPANLAYQADDFLGWAAQRRIAPRLTPHPTGQDRGAGDRGSCTPQLDPNAA